MKALAFLLTFVLLSLTLTGNLAFAEADTNEEPAESEVTIGIDPQSPFWFLQHWSETLRLRLTFRQERKNQLLLQQLERRELELELLQDRLGKGSQRSAVAMERVTANYNKQLEQVALRIEKTAEKQQSQAEKMEQRLEQMLERQLQRLERIEEIKKDHPDTPGLQRILEKGRKGVEKQQKNNGK